MSFSISKRKIVERLFFRKVNVPQGSYSAKQIRNSTRRIIAKNIPRGELSRPLGKFFAMFNTLQLKFFAR